MPKADTIIYALLYKKSWLKSPALHMSYKFFLFLLVHPFATICIGIPGLYPPKYSLIPTNDSVFSSSCFSIKYSFAVFIFWASTRFAHGTPFHIKLTIYTIAFPPITHTNHKCSYLLPYSSAFLHFYPVYNPRFERCETHSICNQLLLKWSTRFVQFLFR